MEVPEDFEIDRDQLELTRREFLVAGTAAAAVTLLPRGYGAQSPSAATIPPTLMKVAFKVNGQPHELELDPRTTLLDALREHLHLTGSKKGCDHGQCGACTVLVGGRRINSCLTLAAMQQGAEITTIEGLGTPEKLHPLQAAFVKCDGYQCGYCTPGQICSAVAMLTELKAGIPSHATVDLDAAPTWSEAEVRERMSGNLCRCGAYSNIFEAIQEVGGRRA
jgi:xanthine dehydrogenase YagT iron-sulfur-binding subunit